MNRSNFKGGAVVVASVLAGLIVGGGVVAWAGDAPANDADDSWTVLDEMIRPTAPPKAGDAVTIGPWQSGKTPPTLTPGQTDDGREGYLRVYDMANATPDKQETRRVDEKTIEIVLPVYEKDGQTVIGEFTAGSITEE